MKLMLYSIRKLNGADILDYSLTLKLKDFYCHSTDLLIIELPFQTIKLYKWNWVNQERIFQTKQDDIFFMVATKRMSAKYITDVLMRYKKQKERKQAEQLQIA